MRRSFRFRHIALVALLALPLAGCLNWQGTYDEAARRECRSYPGDGDRRACLDRADDNSHERRASQHRD
jgi:hypothetical protein